MMADCLMASHGYPPSFVFPQDQSMMSRVSKEGLPFLPNPGAMQDVVKSSCANLRMNQKGDIWRPMSVLLEGNHFAGISSTMRRQILKDFQDSQLSSEPFSFGVAEHCTRQEMILKYIMSGSSDIERDGIDLSILFDQLRPQTLAMDMHQQPFASNLEQQFHDYESQPSLVYPSSPLYLWEPPSNLIGDLGLPSEPTYHSDGLLSVTGGGARLVSKDMLSVISEFYLSNDSTKCTKQAMVVPYFDRKTCRSKAKSTQNVDDKAASLRRTRKENYQTAPPKKSNKKAVKERDTCRNNYLYACESLLSIMVDKKGHGKTAICSLKKSGPELPRLLTQFSASIAGTGIAVLFSVVCKVACSRVAFCAPKLLSTGFGLGLLWLSWAVNNLRDSVVAINRSPGKLGMTEEKMMNNLDRNVKEIYFRAATLLVVAVLRLA